MVESFCSVDYHNQTLIAIETSIMNATSFVQMTENVERKPSVVATEDISPTPYSFLNNTLSPSDDTVTTKPFVMCGEQNQCQLVLTLSAEVTNVLVIHYI